MTTPRLSHEEIQEEARLMNAWERMVVEQLLADVEAVAAQRDAWKAVGLLAESMPMDPPHDASDASWDENARCWGSLSERLEAARALDSDPAISKTETTDPAEAGES